MWAVLLATFLIAAWPRVTDCSADGNHCRTHLAPLSQITQEPTKP